MLPILFFISFSFLLRKRIRKKVLLNGTSQTLAGTRRLHNAGLTIQIFRSHPINESASLAVGKCTSYFFLAVTRKKQKNKNTLTDNVVEERWASASWALRDFRPLWWGRQRSVTLTWSKSNCPQDCWTGSWQRRLRVKLGIIIQRSTINLIFLSSKSFLLKPTLPPKLCHRLGWTFKAAVCRTF